MYPEEDTRAMLFKKLSNTACQRPSAVGAVRGPPDHSLVCPLLQLEAPAITQFPHGRQLPQLPDIILACVQDRSHLGDQDVLLGRRAAGLDIGLTPPLLVNGVAAAEAEPAPAVRPLPALAKGEAERASLPAGPDEDTALA